MLRVLATRRWTEVCAGSAHRIQTERLTRPEKPAEVWLEWLRLRRGHIAQHALETGDADETHEQPRQKCRSKTVAGHLHKYVVWLAALEQNLAVPIERTPLAEVT